MWLFPGKGPSQRLGDGNGIFNKWPGKLLIIVPFLGLQFLCPESLSSYVRLLVLGRVRAVILKLCLLMCVVLFLTFAFVMMPLLLLLSLFGLQHVSIIFDELPSQM